MPRADVNQLFARMGREPEPCESARTREARRARVVANMREVHVRVVHERDRRFGARRRVHVLLVAAAITVAGAAFAAAAGMGPFARFRAASDRETAASPTPPRPSPSPLAQRPEPPAADPASGPSTPPVASEAAPAAPTGTAASSAARAAPSTVRHDAASDLETVNRWFSEAKRAKREGRDTEALRLFEQLLARYPRSVLAQEALVERMRSLSKLGRTAEATRAARSYLARYPGGFAREEAERLAARATAP